MLAEGALPRQGRLEATPTGVAVVWEFSSVLFSVLVVAAAVYARGALLIWNKVGAGRGITYWQAACFSAGIVVGALALTSPLQAASENRFSIHMLQHLLLIQVAALLLAWGSPMLALLWAVPSRVRRLLTFYGRRAGASFAWRWTAHPGFILGLYVVMVWFWHLPQPYQAALKIGVLHHLEHSLLLMAAGVYWWRVAIWARGPVLRQGLAMVYLFVGMLAGGALGGFLTLIGKPLSQTHLEAQSAGGWRPLPTSRLGRS
jgi:putative membrane protein